MRDPAHLSQYYHSLEFTMPAVRAESKPATRQLTLTGKPAPLVASSSKSSKSSVERVYTDAILCIKPEFMDLIVSQEKNHEYRGYRMRDTVERIWLYVTAPTSALTYVCDKTTS